MSLLGTDTSPRFRSADSNFENRLHEATTRYALELRWWILLFYIDLLFNLATSLHF